MRDKGVERADDFREMSKMTMGVVECQQPHWRVNIRELENFLQRAVIMTRTELSIPLAELETSIPLHQRALMKMKSVPHRCEPCALPMDISQKWKAAERFSINRTTLIARMKKLENDAKRLRQL